MNAKLFFAAAILLTIGFHAQAQVAPSSRVQHARIKQGVRNGELTRSETTNLARDQRKIRKNTRVAKADGVVTRVERKEIRQDKRQANRKIYRKKHNNRDRN